MQQTFSFWLTEECEFECNYKNIRSWMIVIVALFCIDLIPLWFKFHPWAKVGNIFFSNFTTVPAKRGFLWMGVRIEGLPRYVRKKFRLRSTCLVYGPRSSGRTTEITRLFSPVLRPWRNLWGHKKRIKRRKRSGMGRRAQVSYRLLACHSNGQLPHQSVPSPSRFLKIYSFL